MYPRVFHIYGPLWINSYGLMIAIGLGLFLWLCVRDARYKQVLGNFPLSNLVMVGIWAGIVGGRALFVLQNWYLFADNWLEVFYPWVGGFSLLGTILALLIVYPLYLRRHHISILPFFDLAALYAPVLQTFARIGCFLAGCCYGAQADRALWWAVTYAHPDSLAPLCVRLHPTQLYSSVLSLMIFCIMYFVVQRVAKRPGQILCVYLMLELAARFVVDFWRGSRDLHNSILGLSTIGGLISPYQQITLMLFAVACIAFVMVSCRRSRAR